MPQNKSVNKLSSFSDLQLSRSLNKTTFLRNVWLSLWRQIHICVSVCVCVHMDFLKADNLSWGYDTCTAWATDYSGVQCLYRALIAKKHWIHIGSYCKKMLVMVCGYNEALMCQEWWQVLMERLPTQGVSDVRKRSWKWQEHFPFAFANMF